MKLVQSSREYWFKVLLSATEEYEDENDICRIKYQKRNFTITELKKVILIRIKLLSA